MCNSQNPLELTEIKKSCIIKKSTKTHFKQKNICIIEKNFVILHPKLVYIGGSMSSMCCFWCLYN